MIEDLIDRGMLDNVLVIALSELGCAPRINGHLGHDHWPQASSCGIKRGVVAGATNAKGIDPAETEFRNAGQPLPIAHEDMHAVKEVLA